MKKRFVVMLTGVFAASMLLSGCEASKGLDTEKLTITQYKGVEVDEVDKPEDITEEDVDQAIEATLQTNATTEEVTGRAVESGDTATIDLQERLTVWSLRADPVRIIRWRSDPVPLSRDLRTASSATILAKPLTGMENFRMITAIPTMRARM